MMNSKLLLPWYRFLQLIYSAGVNVSITFEDIPCMLSRTVLGGLPPNIIKPIEAAIPVFLKRIKQNKGRWICQHADVYRLIGLKYISCTELHGAELPTSISSDNIFDDAFNTLCWFPLRCIKMWQFANHCQCLILKQWFSSTHLTIMCDSRG